WPRLQGLAALQAAPDDDVPPAVDWEIPDEGDGQKLKRARQHAEREQHAEIGEVRVHCAFGDLVAEYGSQEHEHQTTDRGGHLGEKKKEGGIDWGTVDTAL